MRVTAILPARGRIDQTRETIARLLATASYPNWELLVVVDDDPALYRALIQTGHPSYSLVHQQPQGGYWQACAAAMREASGTLLIALANDLLPCRDWLSVGVAAYQRRFGQDLGLLGANDGVHRGTHAAHFLIHRQLLDRYGGWPIWYKHGYGDLELCHRAISERRFAVAPFFVLFHNHPVNGGQWDEVYAEGSARHDPVDSQTFERRRSAGWPRVSASPLAAGNSALPEEETRSGLEGTREYQEAHAGSEAHLQ